ncbi:uncharacterized protein EV420DRAFT_1487239 [Desarmillaria tabescens]|uniref:Uncharacterized protein n=1 Tax=Armillaria tabescens TaxID=1929756 RepID=A0AA39MK05_ARMTA|nr:uncharacterized protein EV420DRAFT_1487239 [Desarmillaria tabescens]KAK0437117.1 hypothetical protein EV420DRAFT_1487239 [Desarmillaria tabescens]
MSSTSSNTFNVFAGFLTAILILVFCFLYGYLRYNTSASRDENVRTDIPVERGEEDMEGEVRVGGVEEQDDADRREQRVLTDGILWASVDPSDEEYRIAETRVDPSTGGTIVGPGTHPHFTCLYISTSSREETFMAYHGFPLCAPDPDEVPEPEEFDAYQHDWALMDAWHQANRLPPLKDRKIPEFDLQYPDSPTIPSFPDLSLTTGRSNAMTRGEDMRPDPQDTSSSDPYDSWSAAETYAASFKPLLRTEEGIRRLQNPSYPMSGGPLENTEKSQNWPTSSSIDLSIQSGTYYTEGSRTLPGGYEIGTGPSLEGEVPTYQRDKNSPYYHDPKTSPSISGLEILRPPAGTTSFHGSMPISPTSATGSRGPIPKNLHPTPDQPPNPAMTKAVTEMDWEELLEWQEGSLANEGS